MRTVSAERYSSRSVIRVPWDNAVVEIQPDGTYYPMIRGAVIKERVAFREAQGIVSSSSRDIEKLTNR